MVQETSCMYFILTSSPTEMMWTRRYQLEGRRGLGRSATRWLGGESQIIETVGIKSFGKPRPELGCSATYCWIQQRMTFAINTKAALHETAIICLCCEDAIVKES
jgi:hypothetical protein